MAPMNIQPKWTINEWGENIEKDWLTHDQSFEWKILGRSVNSRTETSQLQQSEFRNCLIRFLD